MTAGSASASGDKSPMSSLPFLGKLNAEKKQTKGTSNPLSGPIDRLLKDGVDGQPPKRRGPKPDSKPALTRRQELNRQAQRSVFGIEWFKLRH